MRRWAWGLPVAVLLAGCVSNTPVRTPDPTPTPAVNQRQADFDDGYAAGWRQGRQEACLDRYLAERLLLNMAQEFVLQEFCDGY